MEQVVGGDWQHGSVVARAENGVLLLACRCRAVVLDWHWRSHTATHRREWVVWRASMDTNAAAREAVPYQQLTPGAARAIKQMVTMERTVPKKPRRARGSKASG